MVGAGGELTETVWNDGYGWAAGGGISDVFPVPARQKVDMPANLNGSGPGRGVPDVAGNADITSGYVTLIDGQFGPAVAGYTAGPGWDACTGLGSVNGSALRDHL